MKVDRVTVGLVCSWLIVGLTSGCSDTSPPQRPDQSDGVERVFVGSTACATCHTEPYADWRRSHHALAMQPADEETVLGNFADASIEYFGTTTQMVRDGSGFVMRTPNSNGEMQDFTVSFTFGVEPLQQYLTDLPDGRKQVLPFAWDTRAAADGGQRWYHLFPDEEIAPDDPLYWTGRFANWNTMCAECHSTDIQVGYEMASDSFSTTWSEVSVGCEACHGPGSTHVDQANSTFDSDYGLRVNLADTAGVRWTMNDATGIAERSGPALRQQQTESCARCHSRRSTLTDQYEYGQPLLDTHRPVLLEEGLYHADGRILDEVYVYGSFIQSKMYRAGVTCSDCHNPHSGELYTGPNPNAICSQCHLPAKFAVTTHAPTPDCVSCHMQESVYMGVDGRRDHSFRRPNTASDVAHYGAAIAAARLGRADFGAIQKEDYPAIARATLVSLLRAPFDADAIAAIEAALAADSPLLRLAALQALSAALPAERLPAGAALLSDPVRSVRIQAALTYVQSRDLLSAEGQRAFLAAADEYRQSLLNSANFPESMTVLGDFEFRMGDNGKALMFTEHAIRLDPTFALARYAYGLALTRAKRYEEALAEFRAAYGLEPDSAQFAYGYAVALNSLGASDEARAVLEKAAEQYPDDAQIQAFYGLLQR